MRSPAQSWCRCSEKAEVTRFRLQKNELLIRIDDASKESHCRIKTMVLRPEWDRVQRIEEAQAEAVTSHHLQPAVSGEPH